MFVWLKHTLISISCADVYFSEENSRKSGENILCKIYKKQNFAPKFEKNTCQIKKM